MEERTLLITGCSSGIGYDAAHALSKRGWRVFATCRAEADCERLRGEGLESFVLDYADPASVEAAVAEVLSRTGGTLDALFNNGAMALPAPAEDLSRDALTAVFNANFLGWHDLTVRLIPVMRDQGHGRIVQCSSLLGFISMPWRGAYNSTKYALEAMSDVMRVELKAAGIHVSLIEPGPIRTELRKKAIVHFETWVDWKASKRDDYEQGLLEKLYTGGTNSRFQLEPSAVTKKLIHALEAPRPKARYFVTTPTYIFDIARRFLPVWLIDKFMARV